MGLFRFLSHLQQTRDHTALMLLVPLVAIAGWLLLLPISPAVQRATLRRFQMQTPTFWQWALQQPIPAMYNAENRAQVTFAEPHHADSRLAVPRYLNHFPFRVLTFGDGRFDFLRDAQPVGFRLESSYQSHRIRTDWQATPLERGGHAIDLQEVVEE